MGGVNFLLQNRSGDENIYCKLLVFAYNLEYLLRLTKLSPRCILVMECFCSLEFNAKRYDGEKVN